MASTSLEAACARDPRLGWRSPSAKNASEVRHAVVPACKSRSGGAETEEYANAVAPAFVASFASVSALTRSMARRSAATVTAGGAYVSTVTNTRGGGGIAFAFGRTRRLGGASRRVLQRRRETRRGRRGERARSDAACATIHAADADAPSVSADAVDAWHPPGGPVNSVTGTRRVSRRVSGREFRPSGRVSGSVVGASFPLEYRRVVLNPEAAFAASATRAGACVGNVLCGVSPATAAHDVPGVSLARGERPTAHLCASVARAYAGSAAATRNVAADDSDSATVSSFAFAAAARHLGTISRRNLRRAATGTADGKNTTPSTSEHQHSRPFSSLGRFSPFGRRRARPRRPRRRARRVRRPGLGSLVDVHARRRSRQPPTRAAAPTLRRTRRRSRRRTTRPRRHLRRRPRRRAPSGRASRGNEARRPSAARGVASPNANAGSNA